MRERNKEVMACLVCLSFLLSVSWRVHAAGQPMVAWGEMLPGSVGYDLYFSSMETGEWSDPLIMSDSPKPDILPTLAANDAGEVWLVWTQLSDVRGILKFRHRISGKWSSVARYVTGLKTNMAPTAIVDQTGEVLLAWSGVQDHDEDIYFSRWQGTKWASPELVHPDNTVPDILPQLTLSSAGKPLLTWMSYENGRYEYTMSEWNGRKWRTIPKKRALFDQGTAQLHELDRSVSSQVPLFIRDTSQTSMIMNGKTGSIRVKESD